MEKRKPKWILDEINVKAFKSKQTYNKITISDFRGNFQNEMVCENSIIL